MGASAVIALIGVALSAASTVYAMKQKNEQAAQAAKYNNQMAQNQAEAANMANAQAASQAKFEADMAIRQNQFMQQQAENNATLAAYEGKYSKESTSSQAEIHRRQIAQLLGKQKAKYGASGVIEGSSIDVLESTFDQGKLDELAILYEGDKNAYASALEEENYRNQAKLYGDSALAYGSQTFDFPTVNAVTQGKNKQNVWAPALMSGAQTGAAYYASGAFKGNYNTDHQTGPLGSGYQYAPGKFKHEGSYKYSVI